MFLLRGVSRLGGTAIRQPAARQQLSQFKGGAHADSWRSISTATPARVLPALLSGERHKHEQHSRTDSTNNQVALGLSFGAAAAFTAYTANQEPAACARPAKRATAGTDADVLSSKLSLLRAYEDAVAWCRTNEKGGKAAFNTGLFPGTSAQGIHNRLCGKTSFTNLAQKNSVLTDAEEEQLAHWIAACNAGQAAKDRDDVREQIVKMLKTRKKYRATTRYKKGVPISQAADAVINAQGSLPHNKWFQRFYDTWQHICVEKTQEVVDQKRMDKYTEATVDNHFYGYAGLKESMLKHGIMDRGTGKIDLKRVVNIDETPQFADYKTNAGGGKRKKGAAPGASCAETVNGNRECYSIDCCWSADGFAYGPHVIFARENITSEMLHDESMQKFDGKINETAMYSTYSLISPNESGVQTGVTLLRRLKMMKTEFDARGLTFPVLILTDNHESRYNQEVLDYCEENEMILWFEESNTSGFLQALDQFNRKLHCYYRKGCKEMKHTVAAEQKALGYHIAYGEVHIGICEFLRVLSNVWFTWSTPLDRQVAFRKVGITQGGLNPDEVDRRKFNMWDRPLLPDERVVTACEHTPVPLHPDELPEPTREDGLCIHHNRTEHSSLLESQVHAAGRKCQAVVQL
jgi:hypothetical protein